MNPMKCLFVHLGNKKQISFITISGDFLNIYIENQIKIKIYSTLTRSIIGFNQS